MLNLILQVTDPVPGVWSQLIDKGLTIAILAVAVYVLWKRDNATNEKINNYLNEDRKEMLDVIKNNTEAFKDLTESMKEISHKLIN